jgi:hypothetical protein
MINNQHQEEYHLFHVPSSLYELVFINDNTSNNTLDKLLNHVSQCRQYSIDTESEKDDNKLALIQINSIPINPPSIVILCELAQLADHDSHKYRKVCELFRLIFRSGNEIYSWGDMRLELKQERNLLTWPILAKLINIQPHFNRWYTWALTQCRVTCLNEDEEINEAGIKQQQQQQQQPCTCHLPSPYRLNELWSLQKALMFAGKLFIDKSCQLSHWAAGLSSHRSSLSSGKQQRMIQYAVHDVIAVTYLIRPITENWTFERIRKRRMDEIFIGFESTELPSLPSSISKKKIKSLNVQKLAKIFKCTDSDIESISDDDDEIYLNQLIGPVDINHELGSAELHRFEPENILDEPRETIRLAADNDTIQQVEPDEVLVIQDVQHITDDQQIESNEPAQCQRKSSYHRRSRAAKIRHNRNHARQQKKHRFDYPIRREYYYRFKPRTAKRVLRYYGVHYRHIKFQDDRVVIGVKTDAARRDYEETLPYNCFDRRNYWRFRR